MGEGLFSELSHWIVLGLVILVVLFLFFSKTGLMPKVASTLLSAVDRWLPVKPSEEAIGSDITRGPIINAQKQLMEDMTSHLELNGCLLNLRDLSVLNDFEDYGIGISNSNGKLYSVIIKSVGSSNAPQLTNPMTSEQQLEVCIVDSQTFYNCYLKDPPDKPCGRIGLLIDTIVVKKDQITGTIGQTSDSYDFLHNYLFKPEPGKVCFIATRRDIGWGCDSTYGFDYRVDNDCIDDIERLIPNCANAPLPQSCESQNGRCTVAGLLCNTGEVQSNYRCPTGMTCCLPSQ